MSNAGENLRVLAIFHFIVGGLYGLYLVFTGAMMAGMGYMTMLIPPSGTHATGPPPEVQKTILLVSMGIGGAIIFLSLLYAALTVWSGVCILRRRSRHFSLVMASINLLAFPLGTVLGIFTFILLQREETLWWYAQVGSTVHESRSDEADAR